MAKATLKLKNGTMVTIEGTPEEVQRLLSMYSSPSSSAPSEMPPPKRARERQGRIAGAKSEGKTPDLSAIVNLVKNCDEADGIEKNILDRASLVDRALLPIYIIHEYMKNEFGLTSGEISKITTELGVRVSQSNTSTTLSSTASRYVMGDRVRKPGQPVRYRLSRRGVQYVKSVIAGRSNDK